ncbi:hypothetical protein JW859_09665 [bacterium]|nr:hypothetical protein [bacterium]
MSFVFHNIFAVRAALSLFVCLFGFRLFVWRSQLTGTGGFAVNDDILLAVCC